MQFKHAIAITALVIGAAGCSSGDIEIAPATSVSNSNNTNNNGNGGNGTENPRASYVNSAGQTIRGSYDGVNCTYSPTFVDAGNNLMVDLTIPALPDGGAYIFQGSLFVGESYTSDAELAAAGISEGGDGLSESHGLRSRHDDRVVPHYVLREPRRFPRRALAVRSRAFGPCTRECDYCVSR